MPVQHHSLEIDKTWMMADQTDLGETSNQMTNCPSA